MENYITLSHLNDFIFCPRSIYFHQLYSSYHDSVYKQLAQVLGTEAHAAIDAKTYSTRANIVLALEVYSTVYGISGKIDMLDTASGTLTERKRRVVQIYDGYVFQLYAQCHALREMGYTVQHLQIYELSKNKVHPIPLPEHDTAMQHKFEALVLAINTYDMSDEGFVPNSNKCNKCIYNHLCDKALLC
jgi:CRISPR-associated protein Cas4